jgi:prepilin-type processing-associated H-X9-DG protein
MERPGDLLALAEETFPRLYGERIEPILKACEVERLAAIQTFWQRAGLGAIATLGAVGITRLLTLQFDLALFAGLTVGLAAGAWAIAPARAVAVVAKRQALKAIAEAINCTYELDSFAPDAIEQFTHWQLVPTGDRATFQDRFAGAHHGCNFCFFDGHVQKKVRSRRSTRWETLFRGQMICIDFPKRFNGTTVIHRDAGMLNFMQAWGTSLQRVGLGDSRLEKAFEVYASDQVEARVLIHPVFMERLLELEAQFRGKQLRCIFTAGRLLVAVEGGDRFELGSMFKTLLDEARVRVILTDVSEIVKLIDAVLTAERGALPQ